MTLFSWSCSVFELWLLETPIERCWADGRLWHRAGERAVLSWCPRMLLKRPWCLMKTLLRMINWFKWNLQMSTECTWARDISVTHRYFSSFHFLEAFTFIYLTFLLGENLNLHKSRDNKVIYPLFTHHRTLTFCFSRDIFFFFFF